MPRLSRRALSIAMLMGVAVCALLACASTSTPFPYNLVHVSTAYDRGGRTVSIDANPTNPLDALAASEQGGLFRTKDGGSSWSHLDSLPAIPISELRFLPPDASVVGIGNPGQVILVTARADTHANKTANSAGIWRSDDGGGNWKHAIMPDADCVGSPAYGIGFVGTTIAVALDCGVVVSTDTGKSWKRIYLGTAYAVAPLGKTAQGDEQLLVCGNSTLGPTHLGLFQITYGGQYVEEPITPNTYCDQFNFQAFTLIPGAALAQPDLLVTLETIPNTAGQFYDYRSYQRVNGNWLREGFLGVYSAADKVGQPSSRPYLVKAHHNGTTTIDLYVYGPARYDRTQCTLQNNSWSCPNGQSAWKKIPYDGPSGNPYLQPIAEDVSDFVFSPTGNCPLYMVSDHGVTTADPANLTTCTNGVTWAFDGIVTHGYDALQMYDIAGQMNQSNSRDIGPTSIFTATQDNGVMVSADGGVTLQGDGDSAEGYGLQAPLFGATDAELAGVTYNECGFGVNCYMAKEWVSGGKFTFGGRQWANGKIPNAGGPTTDPPVLLRPGQYAAWSDLSTTDTDLYLSMDDGATWTLVSALSPQVWKVPHDMQVVLPKAKHPVIYSAVQDVKTGEGRLFVVDGVEDPNTGLPRFTSGLVLQNISLGLVWPGPFGNFTYHFVYGADRADACHLIATDLNTNQMVVSHTGGVSWTPDTTLTQLVTQNNTLSFSTNVQWIGPVSQATTIAIDPLNSDFIAVGTMQAGIIISNDGGKSWKAIPESDKLHNITSFFFDDLHHQVYAGTYSRGLWRFDWTNFPRAEREDIYGYGTPSAAGNAGGICTPPPATPTPPSTVPTPGAGATPTPNPTQPSPTPPHGAPVPTPTPTPRPAPTATNTPTAQCPPFTNGSADMNVDNSYLNVETNVLDHQPTGAHIHWTGPAAATFVPENGALLADMGAGGAATYASLTCSQLMHASYTANPIPASDGEVFLVKTPAGRYAKVLVSYPVGTPGPSLQWQTKSAS